MVGIPKNKTYDKERFSINIARLKKGGETFEVVINSEEAIAYKNKEITDISEAVVNEKIFSDAKKGELASEDKMQILFGTTKPLEIAKIILDEGEIQLTTEYRNKLREQKKQQIIGIINANAIDGRTGLPIPTERIKNALEEKKIHIDEFKPTGKQAEEVIEKLRDLIPIKFGKEQLKIIVPATSALKALDFIKRKTEVKTITWLNNGNLEVYAEVNAGKYKLFLEELENLTHGSAEIKTI